MNIGKLLTATGQYVDDLEKLLDDLECDDVDRPYNDSDAEMETRDAVTRELRTIYNRFMAKGREAVGLKRNAKVGNQSTVDGAFRVANMVKGWFQTLTSPWDKTRNFLQVNAVALDPLKSIVAGADVVNMTEGAKPSIDSVLDTLTGKTDEIKVGDPLYVAGKDIAIDTSKTDEFVALKNKKTGTVIKGAVSRSDNQTIDCTFEDATIEPGEYTFIVQTRSGLGDDFGVASATRVVRVVG